MGRKGIAALICEPFLVVPGLHILPQNYFERLYATVRENGGVFIADENQTGLGRIGTHNWAFQKTGIIPDIVTTGTSIGNGHPMVCSNQCFFPINRVLYKYCYAAKTIDVSHISGSCYM